jgi:[acyl-carrier-protein] S-malonyltransferase
MKKMLVFPGQGSQFVGMAKTLYDGNASARQIIETADQVLGYKLSEIMFSGPDEKLGQTMYTQPALYVHSLAAFTTLEGSFEGVAGHSLGEFSALAAAGVFSFEDGLKIVAKRGELMQAAGASAPGTMAAVIGMPDETVEKICAEASSVTGKTVVPANYNCPGQLVISGEGDAVQKAMELLSAAGCKLVKKLNVSGAFHSPLMRTAYNEFKVFLESFEFKSPTVPVYQNVTAQPVTNAAEIKHNVTEQLVSPVRWTQTLIRAKADGFTSFLEVGSGKVLQGLIKRSIADVEIAGIQ